MFFSEYRAKCEEKHNLTQSVGSSFRLAGPATSGNYFPGPASKIIFQGERRGFRSRGFSRFPGFEVLELFSKVRGSRSLALEGFRVSNYFHSAMLEQASKNPRECGFSKLISRQSEGFEVFEIIFQGERLSLARSRGFSSFELFSLGNVRSLEKKGVFRLTSPSRPDSSTASQCAREHFDRSSQRMLDSIPESPFLAPFRDPNFHLIFQNPHENRLECVFLSNLVEIR